MPKNEILIHIIADDREQKSEVIRALRGMENIKVEIRRLSIGDYQGRLAAGRAKLNAHHSRDWTKNRAVFWP